MQYVRSVSRETGVISLQPLATEKDLLQDEKQKQEEIVSDATKSLETVKFEIFHKTTSAIQAWFCAFLALKNVSLTDKQQITIFLKEFLYLHIINCR